MVEGSIAFLISTFELHSNLWVDNFYGSFFVNDNFYESNGDFIILWIRLGV